jgi:hypothetical protein
LPSNSRPPWLRDASAPTAYPGYTLCSTDGPSADAPGAAFRVLRSAPCHASLDYEQLAREILKEAAEVDAAEGELFGAVVAATGTITLTVASRAPSRGALVAPVAVAQLANLRNPATIRIAPIAMTRPQSP